MFSWKPIFLELGRSLLEYRDRQSQLLGWLADMRAEGIPAIGLHDRDAAGATTPLATIDPFTFFANINRPIKDEHRRRILQILKSAMSLQSEIPSDFDGVPVANSQKAWFFPFLADRRADDVESLWRFASDIVRRQPEEVDERLYERCLEIKQVGIAKLTMGMFWLRPDLYVALDGANCDYFKREGPGAFRDLRPKTWSAYLRTRDSIVKQLGTDFASISHQAYLDGGSPALDVDTLDAGLLSYLRRLAGSDGGAPDQLRERILVRFDDGETELTNREKSFGRLGKLLAGPRFAGDDVAEAGKGLYLFSQQVDSVRRGSYLQSEFVVQDIKALVEDPQPPGAARINDFIEAAGAHGYCAETGEKDVSAVAQFASVLLSSRYPDYFVDFRMNRWNRLYKNVMGTSEKLVDGDDYGQMMLRAAAFARALAQTKTFRRVFGEDRPLWTAAAVAWALKDEVLPEVQAPPDPPSIQHTPAPIVDPSWKSKPRNRILYGPPGTGKTWALRSEMGAYGGIATAQSRCELVTFHQSYGYEDFIEAIRPDLQGNTIQYRLFDGVLKALSKRAEQDPERPYCLFIDEINRGNVASIFGELITLLEDDKRIGAQHELRVRLPYSREYFGVPGNLFVVGTMNTADRSVEAIDTALRRRFVFEPYPPNPALLRGTPEGLDVELDRLLATINERLSALLDTDRCIGHGYFMGLNPEAPLDSLRLAFRNKIIPLLQEYFYNSPAKIQLVLGDEFVKAVPSPAMAVEGADVDLPERFVFVDVLEMGAATFRSIYE